MKRIRRPKRLLIWDFFRMMSSIQSRLGLIDRETIYIEGGIGSQILAIMKLWDQIDIAKSRGSNPKCDISYFDREDVGTLDNGLSIWKWKLDRYGITKSALGPYVISRPRFPWKARPPLYTTESTNGALDWSRQRTRYSSRFPIDRDSALNFLASEFKLNSESDFAAIHIRRGDYLRVATHLVSDSTYLNFLKRIRGILPNDVLLFSDSPLSESFKGSVREILREKRSYFHDSNEIDECTIHDVMRMSSLLVTGNSTFSFSAGLLAQDECMVFAPMKFYGGKNGDANSKYFRDSGDFFLCG